MADLSGLTVLLQAIKYQFLCMMRVTWDFLTEVRRGERLSLPHAWTLVDTVLVVWLAIDLLGERVTRLCVARSIQ